MNQKCETIMVLHTYNVQTAVYRRIKHGRIPGKTHWLQYASPLYTVSTAYGILHYIMCVTDSLTTFLYVVYVCILMYVI